MDLRNVNPVVQFKNAITLVDLIYAQNRTPVSKIFLEIGTGRRLNVPIALWLCGAEKIITADLNPYLKTNLVIEDIAFIRANPDKINSLFGQYSNNSLFKERFNRLLKDKMDETTIFELFNIEYLAPTDATNLNLPDDYIDFHISRTTFEHIPPDVIAKILKEGKRILNSQGLFIHMIDMADHFAYSDKSISAINFLQFNEEEWRYYAGNRYMYHNRLRVDDFKQLFQECGLRILNTDINVDQRSLETLKNGFPINQRFKDKSNITNATTRIWIVSS